MFMSEGLVSTPRAGSADRSTYLARKICRRQRGIRNPHSERTHLYSNSSSLSLRTLWLSCIFLIGRKRRRRSCEEDQGKDLTNTPGVKSGLLPGSRASFIYTTPATTRGFGRWCDLWATAMTDFILTSVTPWPVFIKEEFGLRRLWISFLEMRSLYTMVGIAGSVVLIESPPLLNRSLNLMNDFLLN